MSIMLMSIVLIPLLGLMADAARIHVQMERYTRSAFLAQLKLEEVKNDATLNFAADYSTDPVNPLEFPAPDLGFKYIVTDTPEIIDDMKAISVEVWYDEVNDENERRVILNTKVARRR